MCPFPPYTPSFVRGPRLCISDPRVQVFLRGSQARTGRIESSPSFLKGASASFGENCLLPLSHFQSRLLADLATTFVPRSTWWSLHEESELWVMFGEAGGDSGPLVTVSISATSDRDVVTS